MEEKKRKNRFWLVLIAIPAVLLLIPLGMRLAWLLKPAVPLNIVLLDKTVLTPDAREHVSFTWLLNNLKIVKKETNQLYTPGDYYGFFPGEQERFTIKDFEKYDSLDLSRLAASNDILYIADVYGIYSNEWYAQKNVAERSPVVYGGLTAKEAGLLKAFRDRKKLVLTEFNCIGSPTPRHVRQEFEELFGVKWTGWIGRYFDDLREENTELPQWLIRNYKASHGNIWPFTKSGIAFISENEQVEILEYGTDLREALPSIYTSRKNARRFSLPRKIEYSYWFDILQMEDTNNPVSLYHISTTSRGDSIMKSHGILRTFPAVIEHVDDAYTFYYFAGDFADNNIPWKYTQLSGIRYIKSLGSSGKINHESFFWTYYYPLLDHILLEYRRNR